MRKLNLAVVVLSVMVFAPCAHAMDLSLNTAVDMILDQSQDLKKAAANVKKSRSVAGCGECKSLVQNRRDGNG